MIRLLVVDDHTAVRAGLVALLRSEPGMNPVGSCGSCTEALAAAERHSPDVVVVDYQLPDGEGLSLCRALKRRSPEPRVLIYSAYSGYRLAVAAVVAGADGLLEKGAAASELFDAIRSVAGGHEGQAAPTREQLTAAAGALEPEDLPILGMLMERTSPAEIAEALRLRPADVEQRIDAMVSRLRPSTDAALQATG